MNPSEIYQRLNDIPRWKENILMAEFAVFLHNLGKCHEYFIENQSEGINASTHEYRYYLITGSMKRWIDDHKIKIVDQIKFVYNQSDHQKIKEALLEDVKTKYFQIPLIEFPSAIHDLFLSDIQKEKYWPGFFIDFNDENWFKFSDKKPKPFRIKFIFDKIDRPLRLGQISHSLCSASEKDNIADDDSETTDSEKEKSEGYKQPFKETFLSTVFGFEKNLIRVEEKKLTEKLRDIEKYVVEIPLNFPFSEHIQNSHLYTKLRGILENTVAETARPRNDVMLWDFSHTVGSLFKAFIVWSILEPDNPLWEKLAQENNRDHLPLNLQYLTISWDYFQFVQSSTKIIDLLSRKAYLDEAIARLKNYLELEMPLANQIFKDENGLAFLAPGCFDKLLKQNEGDAPFRKTLENFFLKTEETPCVQKYAELIPDIQTVNIDFENEQKNLGFGKMIGSRTFQHTSDAEGFQHLWENIRYDVCPVCGLRPIGYDDSGNPSEKKKEKAKQRKVCLVCEERRIERSEDWVKNHSDRTIWIEELCDENDRVALITGRFGLDDWFDQELNLGASISKIISFARARRIWETTAIFWKELFENELINNSIIEKHTRLKFKPFNGVSLAAGHAFEADQNQDDYQRFQIYWDGEFIHVISRNGEKINFDKELRVYPEEKQGKAVRDIESAVKVLLTHNGQPTEFTPFIELLREPALAMALVPANNALACIKEIKEKYDREMGKVKDRLPLNLGVVFFPKNTPIAPVIDAGRRMSHYSFGPEKWEVIQTKLTKRHPKTGDPIEWQIDAKEQWRGDELKFIFDTALGNGKHDEFHCKLLKVKDDKKDVRIGELKGDGFAVTPIKDIQKGDFVRVSVSHFDFIFLDQAGKRFELALDDGQIHRFNEALDKSPGTRPYLLEDFSRLEKIWEIVQQTNLGKSNSALHGFRDLLLQKYRSWKIGSSLVSETHKSAYAALVQNVIHKEITSDLTDEAFQVLFKSINDGVFFDCLELHLHILKQKQTEN